MPVDAVHRLRRASVSQGRRSVAVMNDARRRALGRRGEDLAAAHLRALGFATIARNVRTRHGEIDMIAFDGRALVFAEVKTRCVSARRSAIRDDQDPLRGLRARQRARLRRLASAWLREERSSRPSAETIRFDAIGVVLDTSGAQRRIDHVEGAF
jgi:putative endonuclease